MIHFADVSPLPNVNIFCYVSGTRLGCDNTETNGTQPVPLDYRGEAGKRDDQGDTFTERQGHK